MAQSRSSRVQHSRSGHRRITDVPARMSVHRRIADAAQRGRGGHPWPECSLPRWSDAGCLRVGFLAGAYNSPSTVQGATRQVGRHFRETCDPKQAAPGRHRPSARIPRSTAELPISGALVLRGGKSGANFDRPIESCPLFLVLTDVPHRGVAWMTSSPPMFKF